MKTTSNQTTNWAGTTMVPSSCGNTNWRRWSKWTIYVRQSLRRIYAVSGCELRIQLRSPALWIIAILTILTTIGLAVTQRPAPGKLIDSGIAAVIVCEGEALFTILLLPFLLSGMFARDKRWRFASLLWTRPMASTEYAWGKGLAAITLSLLISLPPLIVGWVAIGIVQGGVQPLIPWLSMIPVVATIEVLAALFALLCINLFPWPLLGALASSGIILYLGFIRPQTLLEITNLVAGTVFYSLSIGFGPDESLLFAQRVAYLALGLLCLFLLALVFQIKERRGIVLRRHRVTLVIAGVLAVTLVLSAVINFSAVASSYQALGPAPSSPAQANITRYQLDVTLDPGTGTVNGKAKFVLTPIQAHSKTFFFALNPGLRVQNVFSADLSPSIDTSLVSSGAGAAMLFSSSLGWTHIDLSSTAFAQGSPVQLTIEYVGHLVINRDYYALPIQAFGPGKTSRPNTFLDYIGQGTALLEGSGSGDWYPLPWTQQAIAAYGNRQVFDDVNIRIPATYKVFCSLASPEYTEDGQWQTINVHPDGVLPMAFLVALASPSQTQLSGIKVFYDGAKPVGQIELFDQEMIQQFQAINRGLGFTAADTSSQSWLGVIVPLIQKPVVGPGLLLLPEIPMLDNAFYSTTAQYRIPAQAVAEAWWLNAMQFSNVGFNDLRPSLQNPSGGVFFPFSSQLLFSMFAGYTGAVITDALTPGFLVREMAVRETFHREPNSADPLQAYMLGIDCCGLTDPPLVLYHLEQKIGSSKVTQLLQQFVNLHTQIPASTRDFLVLASKVSGRDITPDAIPYLCPAVPAAATATSNSFQCLNDE